jgi:hypothetical protein
VIEDGEAHTPYILYLWKPEKCHLQVAGRSPELCSPAKGLPYSSSNNGHGQDLEKYAHGGDSHAEG